MATQKIKEPLSRYRKYEWEVIEQFQPWDLQVKVYLIDRSGIPSLAHIGKDGNMYLEEIKEGLQMEPTLNIPSDAWEAIKGSILEQNKKPDVESLSELKATKYHLEDMRKIVFKD